MLSRSLPTLALCLGFGVPVAAQLLPAEQPAIFWRVNDLVTVNNGVCTIQARTTGKTRSFKIPSEYKDIHVTDEGFWANRKTGREGSRDIEVHFSADGIHWHLRTSMPVRGKAPSCRIFALRDRFLAIATSVPFVQGEMSSHFAILKQGKGSQLELDSLLLMGIGKNSPDWIFVPPVIQIPDGWAIVNVRTGHVWLVKDGGEQARIQKAKLYASVKDEAIQNLGSIDPPILACQPMLDGALLIAARSEEAILKAPEFRKKARQATPGVSTGNSLDGFDLSRSGPNPDMEARLKEVSRQIEQRAAALEGPILERFPDVIWWELNPTSGLFIKTSTPNGAPSQLLTPEIFRSFRFRFDVKGRYVSSD